VGGGGGERQISRQRANGWPNTKGEIRKGTCL